ncbi:hypothetical protein [Spirosoma lituiforme]
MENLISIEDLIEEVIETRFQREIRNIGRQNYSIIKNDFIDEANSDISFDSGGGEKFDIGIDFGIILSVLQITIEVYKFYKDKNATKKTEEEIERIVSEKMLQYDKNRLDSKTTNLIIRELIKSINKK